MKTARYFLLILVLAAGCATSATASEKKPDEQMGVPAEMKLCNVDSDCVLIDTLCSGCCGYESVSQQSLESFSQMKQKFCADWYGGMCDCYSPVNKPICVKGICQLTLKQ